jgi:hypothetical protein
LAEGILGIPLLKHPIVFNCHGNNEADFLLSGHGGTTFTLGPDGKFTVAQDHDPNFDTAGTTLGIKFDA